MKNVYYRILAFLTGKNSSNTPVSVIRDQLLEPRALPMGRQEFEEWSDRIISGALLTADIDSQKYTLANLLLHLGPTESHKPDMFFISSLRKFAVNQVADAIRQELFKKAKERTTVQLEADPTPVN